MQQFEVSGKVFNMLSHLGIVDYVIFGLTLCMSASIGIYFGCFGNKQKSAKEYLYGAGKMKAVPVGLSIYSSAISAITIIGSPTEYYTFGTQFYMHNFGAILSLVITWTFILPVFCGDLNIKTPYEYIEMRFNYKARLLASLIYVMHTLLYMPVVLYGATLSFSITSGIPLLICTTIVGGVCVFYTMLGGFTAVIWSDALQATLMIGACSFVMVKGIYEIGGISEVWKIAEEGGRIQFFNMNLNPFQRITFWSAIFGFAVGHSAHNGCGASSIQRFMALGSEKQARISTLIGVSGIATIGTITGLIGLAMYAMYHNCDPVANHEIDNSSKILSYYISQLVGNIPGFTGFFNAGILCAGLSTLSAELNTVGGLIYHDIIQKFFKDPISDTRGALIMKCIVLINGLYYISVVPILENAKYLFPLTLSIGGLTYGAKIGILILGTALPKSNSLGAICGMISGIIVVGWITFSAMYYDISAKYELPIYTTNCLAPNITEVYNITTVATVSSTDALSKIDDPFILYELSFLYYPVLGLIVTLTVAMVVSYATGPTDASKIDQRLLIPSLRVKDKELYSIESQKMLHKDYIKE